MKRRSSLCRGVSRGRPKNRAGTRPAPTPHRAAILAGLVILRQFRPCALPRFPFHRNDGRLLRSARNDILSPEHAKNAQQKKFQLNSYRLSFTINRLGVPSYGACLIVGQLREHISLLIRFSKPISLRPRDGWEDLRMVLTSRFDDMGGPCRQPDCNF